MPRRAAILILVLTLSAGGAATAGPDWEAVSREALDYLGDYLRIRTVNPPADTREAAAFLQAILENEGIPVRTFEPEPGKVNLLARLKATHPAKKPLRPLMLLHHMDVVPVDPARWPVDPFAGEVREGYIYGRGAADMKQTGIIHLLTLLSLKRQGIPLERDILFLATADEETGGQAGARWLVSNHWNEMDPEYVLDEGGFGARDVLAADGRLVFGISVAEKKILWARLSAEGTAGHGSQPTLDNPNVFLAEALDAITSRPVSDRSNPILDEHRSRTGELADNKFTRAIQQDTLSLTSLRSGVGDPPKVNVIPSTAEATIDCRLLPDTDADSWLEALLSSVPGRERLETEVIYRMDETPVSPHDTPLFRALETAIRNEHPEAVVTPMVIPYGTDSNTFRTRGAVAYGIVPMVLDASIIASMHSDAERVPVAELGRGIRIFYHALAGFCAPAP